MKTTPGQPCTSYAEVENRGPGAFAFAAGPDGQPAGLLLLHLPRVGVVALPITPNEQRIHWEWNGDRAQPSLTPSIRSDGGARGSWHGYLTAGQLKEC